MIKQKLISLALSIVLAVPGFIVYAADGETDGYKAMDSFEYNAMTAMDLLCPELEEASADSAVSRADFAGCVFTLGGYDVQTAACPFIDLNKNNPHYGEIITLYNMHIIGGTDAKTFSPDDGITYAQAAKMCIEILGCGEYAKAKYGDYPHGYILMANQLKLNNGVISDENDLLTADAAVKLLYNTGATRISKLDAVENGNLVYDKNSPELFEQVHDFVYDKGVMTADGVVNLAGSSENDGIAIISGVKYRAANVNLNGLIGAKVDFIYKKSSVPELVYAQISSDSDSKTIAAAELNTADFRYSPTCFVYDESGKSRTLSVDAYADFIYNNQLCTDITKDNYRLIKPQTGFIRFADSDGDGVYDVVVIEEFENLFVTAIADDGNFISDKFGNSLQLDEYNDVFVFVDGVAKLAADIPINRVASVVRSQNKQRIYIYVTSDGITDNLKSISDDADTEKLGFGDNEYKISPTYYEIISGGKYTTPEITVGGKYKYYFDKDGNIAYLDRVDGSSLYAYLIDAKMNNDVFDSDLRADLRLLLSTDEKVTVTTAKKITIDGTENMSGADLLSDHRITDSNGDVIKQVVKVVLTADSELKKIDIADECTSEYGYENGNFVKNLDKANGTAKYYGSNIRMFDLKYFVNADTVCFAKFNDFDEKEPYYVVSATSLSDKKDYSVDLYDCNEKLEAAAMSVTKSGGGLNGALFLVDGVRKVTSGSEQVYSVTGMYNGKTVTYTERNEGIITKKLKRGDVIKIGLYGGKISSFNFICSLSEGKPKPYVSADLSAEDYVCGKIYSVGENNVVILTPDDKIESLGRLVSSSFAGTRTKALYLSVYDARFNTLASGKMNDIAQICSPLADGTIPDTGNDFYIIMNKTKGYIRDAIIVYY